MLFLQDVDEVAPKIWQEMNASVSPCIFYSNLNPSKQKEIEEWKNKRNIMINGNIQKSVTKSLQSEVGMERKCTSFIRLNVRATTLTENERNKMSKTKRTNEAILTVWDPSEEQLELGKEKLVDRKYEKSLPFH